MEQKKKSTSTKKTISASKKKNTSSKKKVNVSTKKTVSKKTRSKQVSKKNETKKKDKTNIYESIKKEIINNEKEFIKKNKYRNLFVIVFAIFCLVVVVISTAMIDFSTSYKKGMVPYLTVRVRDDYNQSTTYYGLFYKALKCDNGNHNTIYTGLFKKNSACLIIPIYNEDGVFINPNKVKMTKSQVNIVKSYYFDDYIYFKTVEELNNAYKISNAINSVWWVKKENDGVVNDDPLISLAIFGKTENISGEEVFNIQYNDPEYYKCVKVEDGANVFSEYNYLDNTCEKTWKSLELDEETCELARANTDFIKNLVNITNLCK